MKSMIAATFAGLAMGKATDSDKKEFLNFVKKFNKSYEAEETIARFGTFVANLQKIAEHNANNEGWTMAVTEFADLTETEFAGLFKGYNHRENQHMRSMNLHEPAEDFVAATADDVDWTTKNAVTPVKNQAQCGSCWAFSTTGGVEGANAVKNGKLVSLSEQQLVDCAGAEGNQGCNGGLMDDGFEYIIKNGGLGSESSYKYTGKDGSCKKVDSVVHISGYKDVSKGNEDDLMSALQTQPVSIAVDAGLGWQLYGGGVMKNCKGKQLDHGVLLVGAGTDGGVDYWKVKNSWGASWGESGFVRLKRGMDSCGLADSASYPTL